MNFRATLLIIFISFLAIPSFSQIGEEDIEDKSDFWKRVYIGGNLGLQFGTITNIEVSPLVGYRFTDRFSAGFGAVYIYYKQKFRNSLGQNFDLETSIYGGRLFARQNITRQFYATAEYESLNLEFYNDDNNQIERQWVPGMFIGGGYFLPLGRKAGLNVAALYNVIYDNVRSPYNSPLVLRMGITAGF